LPNTIQPTVYGNNLIKPNDLEVKTACKDDVGDVTQQEQHKSKRRLKNIDIMVDKARSEAVACYFGIMTVI